MKYSDFEIIYEKVIKGYCNELIKKDPKALSIKEYRIPLIYFYYEKSRKNIRKLYMQEQSKPMDRHKIASNFIYAILKAKILKVNKLIANLPLDILLANEYLAFYTAISIVEIYRIDDEKKDYSISLPDTYIKEEGEDSYIENTCKALYYTKHFNIGDIFSYANILFLLEKHTDYQIELSTFQKNNSNQEQEN